MTTVSSFLHCEAIQGAVFVWRSQHASSGTHIAASAGGKDAALSGFELMKNLIFDALERSIIGVIYLF